MRGREGGSVAGGGVNREISFLAERAFAKKRKTDAGS
jgi:hypothetical protein